jgi:hypothetical protein
VKHSGEHEACEGEGVESVEGCSEALIVSGESAEACGPGEGAFDHPAAWQQGVAALGHGMLDDFVLDPMLTGDLMWTFDPLRRLAPSYPAREPDSGVDCSVRLSRQTAVGWHFRPPK